MERMVKAGLREDLKKSIGILTAYGLWILTVRLLSLTYITYFQASSSLKFEEINETFASNELISAGFAALMFVFLINRLNPLIPLASMKVFTPERFEKRFMPGFLHGTMLAMGLVLAFLLTGVYRYLGFFIQFDEAPSMIASILTRIATLAALTCAEEYIFRHKLHSYLKKGPLGLAGEIGLAGVTAAFYCGAKLLQFDLGFMHTMTLFLLSLALSLRNLHENDFLAGAGFLASLLIVFHPLLSLPILGNEFSGALLVKYEIQAGTQSDAHLSTMRFITGGAGGPLAGFAFQLLLILEIFRSAWKYKKTLSKRVVSQVK